MASQSAYVIEPLGPHHDRKTFSCGEPSLDAYIQRQAGQDVKRDLAACYILCPPASAAIVGYYTLSASSVELTELPLELAKQSGRYPLIPAVLRGRLAVDQRYHGQGMSSLLLVDALRRALRAGVGVKLVLVDALHEHAAAFYEHFEFRRFEATPLRLYLPVSTIRDLFPRDAAPPDAPTQREQAESGHPPGEDDDL